ncbi:molybdenum cofactor biosynthesis enzyme MoaA [Constrictibacter sp. MBR-5]|jgi:molybdenum cofactor biosynthesis enzyme MoaA|uniref:radical SAM/SPASM domain-containing protein n=1 Tax=Constrictibacter sp. MBR-5 TaxID=3156467 RepID=UPI003390D46E
MPEEPPLPPPTAVRIDAAAGCQLRCPLCPVTTGATHAVIGTGALKAQAFESFLDANPSVRLVELANSGEAVLNTALPEILRIARDRGVTTRFDQGVNLNHVAADALEAMVTCGTDRVRVSIDGATQATYGRYRVRGDLRRVLRHVQILNGFKRQHGSTTPELVLQFIVFGHNEHELDAIELMARALGMRLELRLNWSTEMFPVSDRDALRARIGAADRAEHRSRTGRHYSASQCLHLWHAPQINWDGKLLGCGRNRWGAFADDALGPRFQDAFNGAAIAHARDVVRGRAAPREDTPCRRCGVYAAMTADGRYLTDEDVAQGAEGVWA